MDISLTPEQETWIEKQVASGKYRSPNEIVQEALTAFMENSDTSAWTLESLRELAEIRSAFPEEPRWTLASLREAIEVGIQSGPASEWDESDVERILARAASRRNERKARNRG